MPVGQQFELAVVVFDQRGAVFHPITAVIIGRLPDLANDRAMDMAAEHALDVEAFGITNDRGFVGADKAHRVLDPLLDRLAQRPITESKDPAHGVHERIEREQKLVAEIAEEREPPDVLHHGVELVAVEDENAAPVRGDMHGVFLDSNRSVGPEMAGEEFVVIARDVDDPRSFARLAQDFLDDVVVFLRPVDSAAERPDINQVTDDVEGVEFVFFQESEERIRAAAPRAQVDVGNPRSTIAIRAIDDHAPFYPSERARAKAELLRSGDKCSSVNVDNFSLTVVDPVSKKRRC